MSSLSDCLAWALLATALYPICQGCTLTFNYTRWTSVLPACRVPPGNPMILPTYRKEKLEGGKYCISGCCLPSWSDVQYAVMPCVTIRDRAPHLVFFKSSNPVDTEVQLDDSYRLVDVNMQTGNLSIAPVRFTTAKAHHDIICGSRHITVLLQSPIRTATLRHGFLNYSSRSLQSIATCQAEVMVDSVQQMDYSGNPIWTWDPAEHLPCHCITGECWHLNGVFYSESLRAVVVTSHFHSGFFLVDMASNAIKWAIAENWPASRNDVLLKRCPSSPVKTVWCGPSHRAQHLGGNMYSVFINGCLASWRIIDAPGQHLCRLMKCSRQWNKRSAVFLIQIDEDQRCYNVMAEIPVPFQSKSGRGRLTVDDHVVTEMGIFTRSGSVVKLHTLGITANFLYNGIPIHITNDCTTANFTLANPLYTGDMVKGRAWIQKAVGGAPLWHKSFVFPPGGTPLTLSIPMQPLVQEGATMFRVKVEALGLRSEVRLQALE